MSLAHIGSRTRGSKQFEHTKHHKRHAKGGDSQVDQHGLSLATISIEIRYGEDEGSSKFTTKQGNRPLKERDLSDIFVIMQDFAPKARSVMNITKHRKRG